MSKRSHSAAQESARMTGRWERSAFGAADLDELVADGVVAHDAARIPGDEEVLVPHADEGVCFQSFFPRGFALPIHPFLRGLLCAYQLQLHDLTPMGFYTLPVLLSSVRGFWGSIPIGVSGSVSSM